MKSGRELDALIAEKIFGGDKRRTTQGQEWWYGLGTNGELPHYSTDTSEAWKIVDKLWFDGVGRVECGPVRPRNDRNRIEYLCEVYAMDLKETLAQEYGDTVSYAICLAALKAAGIAIN